MFHPHAQSLETMDSEVSAILSQERRRQEDGLELIASENYCSPAVMEAQGSVLTNKYAEGYPGKRYYGGCRFVDDVESMAIERAKKLFHTRYANVQPHSGSQANMAVYLAALSPGDKILGMSLSEGGHLTHGSPVNFSGRLFSVVSYGLHPQTECLDYDLVRDIALKERPKMIIAGASAYPRQIDFHRFRQIADEVGAYLFVDMAHIAGLVAAGLHPSPMEAAHFVASTTHKTLRGPRGGLILTHLSEEWGKKLDSAIFPGIQGGPWNTSSRPRPWPLPRPYNPSSSAIKNGCWPTPKHWPTLFLGREFLWSVEERTIIYFCAKPTIWGCREKRPSAYWNEFI